MTAPRLALFVFQALDLHAVALVMRQYDEVTREYDEADPKKPRPVSNAKKRSNPAEVARCRKREDDDRDHHRHVV